MGKSMKISGSSSRKKRHGDGGTSSTLTGSKDLPASGSGSASAPIPITSDIGGFLRSKTDSEETKMRKVEVDMLRTQTKAKVAENEAMENALRAFLQVANTFAKLLEKQMGCKQDD